MVDIILWVLLLFVVQTLLPASIRYLFAGPGVGARLARALGSRDTQPPLSMVGERAQRALRNLFEALPVFLALAFLVLILGKESALALQGAGVFLIARVAYVPAYLSGVYFVRSLVWAVGVVGLVMMAVAVAR